MSTALPGNNKRDLCRDTLAIILAGGQGTRLRELTRWEAKPALPFGGHYRHIDFPLSNCLNSGIRRVGLLTQYLAHSLIQHVQQGWGFLRADFGEFVEIWPAQQRTGCGWYTGTANAVYQNIDIVAAHEPEHVLVLAGDHIYKMDYMPMIEAHVESGADVTVGSVEVALADARDFGVLATGAGDRVLGFAEKPRRPDPIPGRPGRALASMGIYVFNRDFLFERLRADAANERSQHDFGRDVIPGAISEANVQTYRFRDGDTGEPAYWRDIGTVERYWQANIELLDETVGINLEDRSWPIYTKPLQCPPVRFGRNGSASGSIVAAGCRIDGAVRHSILFTGASVGSGSDVENALLLPGARVGRDCFVRSAIIDSRCVIPDGCIVGETAGDGGRGDARTGHRIVIVQRARDDVLPTLIEPLRVA
jgi:glucose-1-phosphate adenylyltransferase